MQWIDGSEIDIKQYTGESLCEKMSLEMWNCGCDMEQHTNWADFIQVAYFIIAFDTELTMGYYSQPIVAKFKEIKNIFPCEALSSCAA